MAGTALTAFAGEIANYVKGASKATNATFITAQTLRTVRDFCKETWMYRETLADINVVENDDDYTLTAITTNCDSPVIHAIEWVKFKEDGAADSTFTFLEPWNLETEERKGGAATSAYMEQTADRPEVYWMEPNDELFIKPIPNSTAAGTGNMRVKAIQCPDLDATTVPTFLYDDWVECIAQGVAGRVLQMASYKWYNPQLAEYYQTMYKQTRNEEARRQRWDGRVRQDGKIKFHRAFTGGHRQRNWIF